MPEYWCLDPKHWNEKLQIPEKYQINEKDKTLLFHQIGNSNLRTLNGEDIKCTHIYSEVIKRLKSEGFNIEFVTATKIPSVDLRFILMQADLCLDMLTYGWFGAGAREAMMLGVPVICYLRPEWKKNISYENPNYVKELPIINSNVENIYETLKNLIKNKRKLKKIGKKSKKFALKWHSSVAGAKKMDKIYKQLIL